MLWSLLGLVLVLAAPSASGMATDFHSLAAQVNAMQSSWTATVPDRFANVSHAKSLCGTWLRGHPKYQRLPEVEGLVDLGDALPESFSWVDKRPDCPSLRTVRDQSDCGSCWAFASTETFNDRLCIHHNNTRTLSTEDTASCCDSLLCGFSMGCDGGQPGAALHWMTWAGVVTGGGYDTRGDGHSCRPYTLPPCAHHVPANAKYPKCPAGEYPTPKCTHKCSEKAYPVTYQADKIKGKHAYSVSGVTRIMSDLFTNGPLSVALTVYADFPTYKSGVYHHVAGDPLGGHAVEMVGWGVEGGVPYWLIKNSWNEMWGLKGYIKIRRGVNECGIEDDVHGITV